MTEAFPERAEPVATAEELTCILADQVRGLRNAIKILAEEVDELCADGEAGIEGSDFRSVNSALGTGGKSAGKPDPQADSSFRGSEC